MIIRLKKFVAAGVYAVAALQIFAPLAAQSSVRPAVWSENYREARAYAERNGIPLLVYYGSSDCGASTFFLSEVAESAELNAWLGRHPIMLAKLHGSEEMLHAARNSTEEKSPYPDFTAARNWIKSAAVKSITEYPFVGLYWRKADGTTVQKVFTGRSGSIPSVPGSGARSLLEKMIALLDQQFGAYTGGTIQPVTPQKGVVGINTLPVYDVQARNPHLYVARTFTVPMHAEFNGVRVVAGLLTVTSSAKGSLSAKYSGTTSATFKFSGEWDQFDLSSDMGLATLKEKRGAVLDLRLTKDGELQSELDLPFGYSSVYGRLSGAASYACPTSVFRGFHGLYTVALPSLQGHGTASLTLNVSKTGKVSWKGVMEDGTAVSGSSQLQMRADGTALLPLYKKMSKYLFSAELVLDGGMICCSGGVAAWHWNISADSEDAFSGIGFAFEKGKGLGKVVAQYGIREPLVLRIGGADVAELTVGTSAFLYSRKKSPLSSLSYSSSTGVFTGKAKVTVGGVSVSGSFRGVILQDAADEHPFGLGTLYVKGMSLPVEIVSK